VRPGASSERAIILAPTGRDASVAAALIREAGYYANICGDLAALMHEIEGGAGIVVKRMSAEFISCLSTRAASTSI